MAWSSFAHTRGFPDADFLRIGAAGVKAAAAGGIYRAGQISLHAAGLLLAGELGISYWDGGK